MGKLFLGNCGQTISIITEEYKPESKREIIISNEKNLSTSDDGKNTNSNREECINT
jgi:hypothetical protein